MARTTGAARPYHHGDLRRALLDAALEAIPEIGPGQLSLRDLARRVGVSHAAPAHHFGDKAGLLTAIAADGYRMLGDELSAAWRAHESFLEIGVAYVRFAVNHRAHFEVMFRPELYRPHDHDVAAARERTSALLYGTAGGRRAKRQREVALAGWSLMHGLAWLWLDGALPADVGDDPIAAARAIGRHLAV